MGKRSEFERKPRDFYPTPFEAVFPLVRHITPDFFSEPCAGNGKLIENLEHFKFRCFQASDIEPGQDRIIKKNALDLTREDLGKSKMIITNPPWDRKILHPMIEHFRQMRPTWLLIDADWPHTIQAVPYMKYCQKMIAVGRLKWIPESKYTGKDNCIWALFGDFQTKCEFIGR